jgi:NAD-dependent dihydropyrimidine dehydrogenase PreA subunit
MVKIIVDHGKCVNDVYRICVEICPVSVFQIEKSGKLKVVNEENCIICRTCQFNCPSQAIEIVALTFEQSF